jgi:hypothetical protein
VNAKTEETVMSKDLAVRKQEALQRAGFKFPIEGPVFEMKMHGIQDALEQEGHARESLEEIERTFRLGLGVEP